MQAPQKTTHGRDYHDDPAKPLDPMTAEPAACSSAYPEPTILQTLWHEAKNHPALARGPCRVSRVRCSVEQLRASASCWALSESAGSGQGRIELRRTTRTFENTQLEPGDDLGSTTSSKVCDLGSDAGASVPVPALWSCRVGWS